MMSTLKCDKAGANAAYSYYRIIRRSDAVVSFEPTKIAIALMKAFLAVRGSLPNGERLRTLVDGLISPLVERVSAWHCQLQVLGLDFKRALLTQATHVQRCRARDVLVGVSVGGGFFSATKPNLRNAR
jgi:hypothetical protein